MSWEALFRGTSEGGGPHSSARACALLRQDSRGSRLVIGLTEIGSYGITDGESERQFKEGMRAIMDAIDAEGVYG